MLNEIEEAFYEGAIRKQKPTEWSEEELDSITAAINNLEYLKNNYAYHQMGLEPAITFLKSLKDRVQPQPKREWSEDDEDIRDNIIRDLKRLSGDMVSPNQTYQKEIQWLKSLRPQNTWKPSDEQMENLSRAFNGGVYRTSLLMELYQDLKKLRGE